MRFRAIWLLALPLCASASAQQNQDYLGARAVLSQMQRAPGEADPKVRLAMDLEAYGSRSLIETPQWAGDEWLKLARRALELDSTDRSASNFTEVVKFLPGPEAWPLIEGSLKRDGSPQDLALILLMDVLQGNEPEVWSSVAKFEAMPHQPPDNWAQREPGSYDIESIKLSLALRYRNPDQIESALRAKCTTPETTFGMGGWREGPAIYIPDLVSLMGPDRAEKLLTYILLTAKAELTFGIQPPSGDDTRNLARRLVAKLGDQVAWPQWTLINSVDSGSTFLKFRKRFPKRTMGVSMDSFSPSSYEGAAVACLVDLFVTGQIREAREFAGSYADFLSLGWRMNGDDSVLKGTPYENQSPAFLKFLNAEALSHPDSSLPRLYWTVSSTHNDLAKNVEFLTHIRTSAKQDSAKEWARTELESEYLRRGKYQKAISVMPTQKRFGYFVSQTARLELALAVELKDPKLLARGLDDAEKALTEDFPYDDQPLIDALVQHGRGEKVEAALIERVQKAAISTGSGEPPIGQAEGEFLAQFYFNIGRYKDVVTLLENYPKWGVSDLKYLSGIGSEDETPLTIAAQALAAAGRAEEIEPAIAEDLRLNSDSDYEYDVLVRIAPARSEWVIDSLIAQFPPNPRPLIWKGLLLARKGRLEEAKTTIRKAISMDPNDLQAWYKGTRFKAYGVLADIEMALGHASQARALRSYAAATRLVREASRFEGLGMLSKACAIFKQELSILPTDFLARLQLAEDMVRLGQYSEARVQVRKALTDLPPKLYQNFGYYGLGVLTPNGVQAEAESFLRQAVAKGSKNPSVHALLGAISFSRGDRVAAVHYFEDALVLDKDCAFALVGLSNLEDLLPTERKASLHADFQRLGLDYPRYRGDETMDYAQAWRAYARVFASHPTASNEMFDLPASRRNLQVQPRTVDYSANRSGWSAPWLIHPGERLLEENVIREISSLVEQVHN